MLIFFFRQGNKSTRSGSKNKRKDRNTKNCDVQGSNRHGPF